MFWFGILSILAFVLSAHGQVNFCDPDLCPTGTTHIGCGNNGAFTQNCPANARMVNLTSHQDLILQMHNARRNRVAGGNLSPFQQARRMATMRWNPQLARMAAFNVKRCQMRHDACRNTPRFPNSGQNLAITDYTGNVNSISTQDFIRDFIILWFSENQNANMDIINNFPADHNGGEIGHFTVMVAARNTDVGCAASRYSRNGEHTILFACNYATTNRVNRPIYATGDATAGCQTGVNPNFPNLCAVGETYPTN